MEGDRTWMWRRRDRHGKLLDEFVANVNTFIQFAIDNSSDGEGVTQIKCPCSKCINRYYKEVETVKFHICTNGFTKGYTVWHHHGETTWGVNGMNAPADGSTGCNNSYEQMVVDGFGANLGHPFDDTIPTENTDGMPTFDEETFYSLLRDAQTPLYDGCKHHTVLSAMSQLLNQKSEGHLSARTFDNMLKTVREMLPDGHKLPKNFYEFKKKMRKLGLGYKKIDSCINNCMLYYKEDMHLTRCRICHHDRFKVPPSRNKKGVPFRVLRYLPLIPRLQRLYMSTKTATHMTWHDKTHSPDGSMTRALIKAATKRFI